MENLDINFINDYIKNEEDIKNCTFDSINGIIDNSNEIEFKNCTFLKSSFVMSNLESFLLRIVYLKILIYLIVNLIILLL